MKKFLLLALLYATTLQSQNVASIGETSYATITDAVAEWHDGDTLTLLADIDLTDEITVRDYTLTLDLNGFGLRQTVAKKAIFLVESNATLTLIDSQPARSEHRFLADVFDHKAVLDENGDLSFTGGYLYGGKGRDGGFEDPNRGGAVNIYNATFIMRGGTILGNQAQFGGAVAVVMGAFEMHGGAICYNATTRATADDQGGSAVWVQSDNDAMFEISGTAEIVHNYAFRADGLGAQVVIFGANSGQPGHYPFQMQGGSPRIIDSANGYNLMLADGNVIRVTGKILPGARIGVTASDAPRIFTSNYYFQNYDTVPSAYFISDNDSYLVTYEATGTDATLLAHVDENDDDIVAKIDQWIGKTISIQLGRTLRKDGTYYTLCLPFGLISLAGTPLEGAQVFAYVTSEIVEVPATGEKQLHQVIEPTTSIEAGKPYLIRWTKTGESLYDLLFENVLIETSEGQTVVDENGAAFIGHIAKEHIDDAPDHSLLFLGANNTLFWPVAGDTGSMKGFRAYFNIPNGAVISNYQVIPGMHATLTIGFGSEQGIEELNGEGANGRMGEWANGRKSLRNGVLLIERNGKTYTLQGQMVNGNNG